MTRQTRYYIQVGSAIVVALVLVGLGIQWLRGTITFVRNYALVVAFQDARGITEGAEVQMAGVRIGRVDDVDLNTTADPPARLRLLIQNPYAIPEGSRFTISTGILAGAPVVKVDPTGGTAGTPIAGNPAATAPHRRADAHHRGCVRAKPTAFDDRPAGRQ
jgi:phospholipid/cholesterol/gamma-HCH transport system substrate-binding protein